MIKQLTKMYKFPFSLHQYQEDDVNYLAAYSRSGNFSDVGLGKTIMSISVALIHAMLRKVDKIVVVTPPALQYQWFVTLTELSELNNNEIKIARYAGTPAERKKIDLSKLDFIICSIGILKIDADYLKKALGDSSLEIIVDEAASVRRPSTKNFRVVRDLSIGHNLQLLTATPITTPLSAYGLIKLKTPDVYRTMGEFKSMHVASYDFWNQPKQYCNLEILKSNLMLNTVARRAEDEIDLPNVVYDTIRYELSPKHSRLYNKLMQDELLKLDDGSVIDATEATAMYHMAQQLVMNPEKFGGDFEPAWTGILDEIVSSLALYDTSRKKLIIFNNYREVNERVYERLKESGLNPVLVYGGLTPKERDRRLRLFLDDKEVRVLVGSPKTIGAGLNLQSVSRTELFLELPVTSADFQQCVGRVNRQGQDGNCLIIIACASKTIQVAVQKGVVGKDDLIQNVFPTPKKMRDIVFGA